MFLCRSGSIYVLKSEYGISLAGHLTQLVGKVTQSELKFYTAFKGAGHQGCKSAGVADQRCNAVPSRHAFG
jgi:hypothetical protein